MSELHSITINEPVNITLIHDDDLSRDFCDLIAKLSRFLNKEMLLSTINQKMKEYSSDLRIRKTMFYNEYIYRVQSSQNAPNYVIDRYAPYINESSFIKASDNHWLYVKYTNGSIHGGGLAFRQTNPNLSIRQYVLPDLKFVVTIENELIESLDKSNQMLNALRDEDYLIKCLTYYINLNILSEAPNVIFSFLPNTEQFYNVGPYRFGVVFTPQITKSGRGETYCICDIAITSIKLRDLSIPDANDVIHISSVDTNRYSVKLKTLSCTISTIDVICDCDNDVLTNVVNTIYLHDGNLSELPKRIGGASISVDSENQITIKSVLEDAIQSKLKSSGALSDYYIGKPYVRNDVGDTIIFHLNNECNRQDFISVLYSIGYDIDALKKQFDEWGWVVNARVCNKGCLHFYPTDKRFTSVTNLMRYRNDLVLLEYSINDVKRDEVVYVNPNGKTKRRSVYLDADNRVAYIGCKFGRIDIIANYVESTHYSPKYGEAITYGGLAFILSETDDLVEGKYTYSNYKTEHGFNINHLAGNMNKRIYYRVLDNFTSESKFAISDDEKSLLYYYNYSYRENDKPTYSCSSFPLDKDTITITIPVLDWYNHTHQVTIKCAKKEVWTNSEFVKVLNALMNQLARTLPYPLSDSISYNFDRHNPQRGHVHANDGKYKLDIKMQTLDSINRTHLITI